ncbi:MAG: hypothetical protein QM535_15040 [Limnohabitans sp.]|nr:hypothetical protein [Limnohabitans sp.]
MLEENKSNLDKIEEINNNFNTVLDFYDFTLEEKELIGDEEDEEESDNKSETSKSDCEVLNDDDDGGGFKDEEDKEYIGKGEEKDNNSLEIIDLDEHKIGSSKRKYFSDDIDDNEDVIFVKFVKKS